MPNPTNRTITATLRYSPRNGLTLLGEIRADYRSHGFVNGTVIAAPEQTTDRHAEIAALDQRLQQTRDSTTDAELTALETRLGKLLAQDVAELEWDVVQAWDDLLDQWTQGKDIYQNKQAMRWLADREQTLSTLNALSELSSHFRMLNEAEHSVATLQAEKTAAQSRLSALTKDLLPEHAANLDQIVEIGSRLPSPPHQEDLGTDATIRLLADLALTSGRAVALAKHELTRLESDLQSATKERTELREHLTTPASVWPFDGSASIDAQLTNLETRLPVMTTTERAAALELMPSVGREELTFTTGLVDALRSALSPAQFAQTAAQLIVRAPELPDVSVPDRHAVEAHMAQMLSDPDTAATLLKDGSHMVVAPCFERAGRRERNRTA